jgi:hypothetical protein
LKINMVTENFNYAPLDTIINVSVTSVPQGLANFKLANFCIFTTEASATQMQNTVEIYRSYADVTKEFGTNSETAKMASAIFSATLQLSSAEGSLMIYKMTVGTTNATGATFTTIPITTTVFNNLKAESNASIGVNLNGNTFQISNLNFTTIQNNSDIVKMLQKKLVDVEVSLTSSNEILFKTRKIGGTTGITFTSGTTGADLTASTLLDISNGTAGGGSGASGQSLIDAVNDAKQTHFFLGFATNLRMEDALVESTSTAVQAIGDKIFFYATSTTEDFDVSNSFAKRIADKNETKTRITYHPTQANEIACAIATWTVAVNMNGTNTATTIHLKELNGISPVSYNPDALDCGIDLYTIVQGGKNAVLASSVNDFVDNVFTDIGIKFYMQVEVFNVLATTNTKIPQTEKGIAAITSAQQKVFERYRTVGYIAPGTWNSPQTIGDNRDLQLQQVAQNGYFIYNTPLSLQPQADREDRKFPLSQSVAKRAGAFHSGNIIIIFEN